MKKSNKSYNVGKDNPMWKKKHSLISKGKMSQAKMGKLNPFWKKKHSKKAKLKMSQTRQGKDHPMYGVHRYEKNAPNWKGGIMISGGYVFIYMPDHPSSVNKHIRRSHLVAEKALGRYLNIEKGEMTHHINENKSDDQPQNILICLISYHVWLHRKMKRLEIHIGE